MSEQNPWRTISTRLVYRNDWMSVREDAVVRPDGAAGIYGVVEARVATGVVALTPHDEVYLVGQWRYLLRRYSWEIPEGGAEPDEDPRTAAARELAEEAGVVAARWEDLGGEVHLSNCFSAEVARLFLARDLSPTPRRPDPTEVLQVRQVPFADAVAMCDRGEITDAMTLIALHRAAALR